MPTQLPPVNGEAPIYCDTCGAFYVPSKGCHSCEINRTPFDILTAVPKEEKYNPTDIILGYELHDPTLDRTPPSGLIFDQPNQ